jgi:hypothetical protein
MFGGRDFIRISIGTGYPQNTAPLNVATTAGGRVQWQIKKEDLKVEQAT